MNTAAAFGFVAAGVCIGSYLHGLRVRKVHVLQTLCMLLREMETETALLHLPLLQTVERLAASETFAGLSFLNDCANRCRGGDSFAQAWNIAVTAFLRRHNLRGDGAAMLPQLGAALLCVSDAQAEKRIGLYLRYLQADLQQAKQTLQTAGRLDFYFCTGGGILLGILVL